MSVHKTTPRIDFLLTANGVFFSDTVEQYGAVVSDVYKCLDLLLSLGPLLKFRV